MHYEAGCLLYFFGLPSGAPKGEFRLFKRIFLPAWRCHAAKKEEFFRRKQWYKE